MWLPGGNRGAVTKMRGVGTGLCTHVHLRSGRRATEPARDAARSPTQPLAGAHPTLPSCFLPAPFLPRARVRVKARLAWPCCGGGGNSQVVDFLPPLLALPASTRVWAMPCVDYGDSPGAPSKGDGQLTCRWAPPGVGWSQECSLSRGCCLGLVLSLGSRLSCRSHVLPGAAWEPQGQRASY